MISGQSDIAVPTVAYVNEKMGLRGIGTDKAGIFTDKTLMRQRCKEAGLPVPDFKICKTLDDALEMLNKHKKIIIKPIDSQSSRGVYTITDEKKLRDKFDDTMSYSNRQKRNSC